MLYGRDRRDWELVRVIAIFMAFVVQQLQQNFNLRSALKIYEYDFMGELSHFPCFTVIVIYIKQCKEELNYCITKLHLTDLFYTQICDLCFIPWRYI